MNKITDERVSHMHGVAEYMYENAEAYGLDKEEMYVVGLLHDIGYLFGKSGHEEKGSFLLERLGFKYSDVIKAHGTIPETTDIPDALKLLLKADLTVGRDGTVVGYNERLRDIEFRYGADSEPYHIVKETVKYLTENKL